MKYRQKCIHVTILVKEKTSTNFYSRIRSLPLPLPSAAVIELRLCRLLMPLPPPFPLVLFDDEKSVGFESDDDFMHRFNGASASSALDAVDTLLLKFKPLQSFDVSREAADSFADDLDKLYAPFDVIVGGNLITSTRSLFCC